MKRTIVIMAVLVVMLTFAVSASNIFVLCGYAEDKGYEPLVIESIQPEGKETASRAKISSSLGPGLNMYDVDSPGYFIELIGGQHAIFMPGAELSFLKKGLYFEKVKFDSNPDYPLTFKLIKDKGFVYLCGRGEITVPDQEAIRIGFEDTIETWLPRVKSADQIVREGAVQALGMLARSDQDKEKVTPVIIEVLKDEAWSVRRNAAEALGRIGGRRAIERLNALLESEENGQVKAVAKGYLKILAESTFDK